MRVRDRPQPRAKDRGYLLSRIGLIGLAYWRLSKWEPWRLVLWAHYQHGPIKCDADLMDQAWLMAKKPEIGATQGGAAVATGGAGKLLKFPLLRGMLTDLTYEGSTERRKPSSVTLRADGGMWLVTLRDPSTGLMLRCTTESYDDIEPALEGLLAGKVVPWEPDPFARSEPNRRRKS